MAGPMVGPLLERLGLDLIETYWEPDGNFPDHEPNPLLPENRRFIIDKVREEAPTSGSPGTATPTAASSSTTPARSSTATSSPRCSPSRSCAKQPGATILYDVRASRAVPDTVTRAGRHRPTSTASATRSSRRACATRARCSAARSPGHYYFRDFYCADSGTIPALLILELLSVEGKTHVRAARALPREVLHLRRDQLRGRRRPGQDGRDRRALRRRRADRLDGISIDYDDWHFNVRPSNTEPLLRLCLESLASAEDMERRRDEVLALIRS